MITAGFIARCCHKESILGSFQTAIDPTQHKVIVVSDASDITISTDNDAKIEANQNYLDSVRFDLHDSTLEDNIQIATTLEILEVMQTIDPRAIKAEGSPFIFYR